MNNVVLTIENIMNVVKPIAEKYHVDQVYLFGSYARGEANMDSDLDFLVYGGDNFKLTMIFALAEELREVLDKNVDVFEIHEINQESEFYNTIMKERLLVAWDTPINNELKEYTKMLLNYVDIYKRRAFVKKI